MPEGVVGYVVGVFDLFHIGHLDTVRLAAAGCDRLVVGVAGDDLAEQVCGARPIVPETERRLIMSAVRCVDSVVPVTDLDLRAQLERSGADVLFVPGRDEVAARLTPARAADHATGRGAGRVRVVPLPQVRVTASTAVRAAGQSRSDRSSVA